MLKGHFKSAEASIDYKDAAVLFPVDELDARVLQNRDAQLALYDADGADVIIVAPTSLATSYFLTQHALTAIPIESLSSEAKTHLADALAAPLDSFDFIQIGKWTTDNPNHSLSEFSTV